MKPTLSFFLVLLFLIPFPSSFAQERQNLNVSATVPAQPSDFQASMEILTPGDDFPQDTDLEYELTYGSYLNYGAPITVEASWSLGTVNGSGSPTVDIVDYKISSASNGYGGAVPVIDTVNRKITWTISDFPGNTQNQTVTFTLTTNSNYTGSQTVNFTVTGITKGPGTQTPDSDVSRDYLYVTPATPTPTPQLTTTPQPGPTNTPGPNPTATPTPTQTPQGPFVFEDVQITSLSNIQATILAQTSQPATMTLLYGTALNNLNQSVRATQFFSLHEFQLTNLTPNTVYYYKIQATNANGQTITTDMLTFKTPLTSATSQIDLGSIIATSANLVLTNGAYILDGIKFIILPTSTDFELSLTIENPEDITRVQAFIQDKSGNSSSLESLEMVETSRGVFTVKLTTPPQANQYEVMTRIYNVEGSIQEEKILNLKVINPLRVINASNKNPIENAKAKLYFFSPSQNKFIEVNPSQLPIKNPNYSNPNGIINWVLLQGKYKVDISALGFTPKTAEFTIGPHTGEEFPTIELTPQPFNLLTTITYFGETINDALLTVRVFIQNLSSSIRFFDLIAVISLAILTYLTLLSFSLRTHLSPLMIPWYIFFLFNSLITKAIKRDQCIGHVYNKVSHDALSGVNVFILDKNTNSVLAHTITNSFGEFCFGKLKTGSYKISLSKKGYISSSPALFTNKEFEKGNIKLYLEIKEHNSNSIVHFLSITIRETLEFCFEALLIITITLELFIGYSLGWEKTLPFLIISLVNLFVWILILNHGRTHEHN